MVMTGHGVSFAYEDTAMRYTVQVFNRALNSTRYVGSWESRVEAEEWMNEEGGRTRKFMTYTLYRGTSKQPGASLGVVVHGSTQPTSPPPDAPLQRECQAADEAWSNEGRRLFGRRWGDVRYTEVAHGRPGSALRRLHDTYVSAREAWEAARCRSAC